MLLAAESHLLPSVRGAAASAGWPGSGRGRFPARPGSHPRPSLRVGGSACAPHPQSGSWGLSLRHPHGALTCGHGINCEVGLSA